MKIWFWICFCLLAGVAWSEELIRFGVTQEEVSEVIPVGHRVQVWEILAPFAGAKKYTLRCKHAVSGNKGAFCFTAWADTNGDGIPDVEVARSGIKKATKDGDWSTFTFSNRYERIFVGNTWEDPETLLYYGMKHFPVGCSGLSKKVFFSRAWKGTPNQSTKTRMTNIQVIAEGCLPNKITPQEEPVLTPALSADERMNKARAGDVQSARDLGLEYLMGKGDLKQNFLEAEKWLTLAAEKGDAVAAFNVGQMYQQGTGVSKDISAAVRWWTVAAEKGFKQAQNNLAASLDKGMGISEDKFKALFWYQKAAEQGVAESQCSLAAFLDKGLGGAKRAPEASIVWYTKSANQGFAEAEAQLGCKYLMGLGVPKNWVLGKSWTEKAALQGHLDAMNNLATVYYQGGKNVPKNLDLAVTWFKKAAQAGHPEAQNALGKLYFKGEGITKNQKEAQAWWLKASEAGLAAAQYNMGLFYFMFQSDALLSEQDSLGWLKKAAAQGHEGARHELLRLQREQGLAK